MCGRKVQTTPQSGLFWTTRTGGEVTKFCSLRQMAEKGRTFSRCSLACKRQFPSQLSNFTANIAKMSNFSDICVKENANADLEHQWALKDECLTSTSKIASGESHNSSNRLSLVSFSTLSKAKLK
jgi:hypothetical protein